MKEELAEARVELKESSVAWLRTRREEERRAEIEEAERLAALVSEELELMRQRGSHETLLVPGVAPASSPANSDHGEGSLLESESMVLSESEAIGDSRPGSGLRV